MLGPEGIFPDRQGAPVERRGLGVVALVIVERRQVVEAHPPEITPAGGAATWRITDPRKPAVIVGCSAPICTGFSLTLEGFTRNVVLKQRVVAYS